MCVNYMLKDMYAQVNKHFTSIYNIFDGQNREANFIDLFLYYKFSGKIVFLCMLYLFVYDQKTAPNQYILIEEHSSR